MLKISSYSLVLLTTLFCLNGIAIAEDLPTVDQVYQAAHYRRFPGTHLTREQYDAAFALHAIQHVRHRFAVILAHEQEARIWRDGKWHLFKYEEILVHKPAIQIMSGNCMPNQLQ